MSRNRLWIVYALMAFLVGGQLLDTVLAREHWPFSNYPMFARLATPTLTTYRLTCLSDGANGSEQELPLDWHAVPNLPLYKFDGMLRHYASGLKSDPQKLQRMLADYISTYEIRRKLGLHHAPAIHGLCLYKVDIPLDIPLPTNVFHDGIPDHSELIVRYDQRSAVPLTLPKVSPQLEMP